MEIVADNQLAVLAGFFLAGVIGTVLIAFHPARLRAWQVADLLWVVLGAFGAVAAVLAGVYKNDSTRIDRQIDIAYAATTGFDRDAARFRLQYCEGPRAGPLEVLCNRVEFLSASTAANADLPLFIAITETAAPLQGLDFFQHRRDAGAMDRATMVAEVNAFDTAMLLEFVALDADTRAAMAALRPARPGVAADYQVLAGSYDMLIRQVRKLKTEWEYLRDNTGVLVVQIIALCLVAFAMPFRLGKAIADMQRTFHVARRRRERQP